MPAVVIAIIIAALTRFVTAGAAKVVMATLFVQIISWLGVALAYTAVSYTTELTIFSLIESYMDQVEALWMLKRAGIYGGMKLVAHAVDVAIALRIHSEMEKRLYFKIGA